MNILERLLPKSGLAFIQHSTKSLTKWLSGIYDGMIAPIIPIQDQKFLDQFPTWTNKVSDWETATGILPKTGSRSVLEARFKAQGGQSPKYIQDTLRGAGFDVYVHEWWDPYTDATRNPLVFLSNGDGTVFKSQFGRVSSQFNKLNVDTSDFPVFDDAVFVQNGLIDDKGLATITGDRALGSRIYGDPVTTTLTEGDCRASEGDAFTIALKFYLGDESSEAVLWESTNLKVSIFVSGAVFPNAFLIQGNTPTPFSTSVGIDPAGLNYNGWNDIVIRYKGPTSMFGFDSYITLNDSVRVDFLFSGTNLTLSPASTITLQNTESYTASSALVSVWRRALSDDEVTAYSDIPVVGIGKTQFGSKFTQTGYALVNRPEQETTVIPSDPNTHPYFMYVGGQIFPFPALVPLSRKSEFERLLLTICPAHLWIGILISYSAPPTEFITLEDGTGSLLLEDGDLIGLE